MLGNAAVARGLYEAGISVASSYPGTPSTEITEVIAKYDDVYSEWAPNEKVALEVAFGASMAGKRAMCAMKHVGLNVAADPLYTMSYTGVNAGLVLCVADDPGMHSSQNEQDSRHHAIASKVPMLEPADSGECYEFAKLAFELSERFDTPVLLRLCTRIAHSQSIVDTGERVVPDPIPYEKNGPKFIMMPAFAKRRHPMVEERTCKLVEYGETAPVNRVEMGGTDLGLIVSGTAYQYAKEVCGDSVSYLKLGLVNPLPEKLILDFAAKVKKLIVIEELDGIIEAHCKALGLDVVGKELFPAVDEFAARDILQRNGDGRGVHAADQICRPLLRLDGETEHRSLAVHHPDAGDVQAQGSGFFLHLSPVLENADRGRDDAGEDQDQNDPHGFSPSLLPGLPPG